ncbi:MAG TPA: hypothetical protein VFG42_26135 [Baekduia sp.]|uniref:hypothetical protein n=1 Tax=Baekduia sp. TaxID=2600305 RepID=UPI002D775821|nr:hypothetical protein [Baekduia sp.]HET6510300.1 hypothetical protein [Baekduia sp.]
MKKTCEPSADTARRLGAIANQVAPRPAPRRALAVAGAPPTTETRRVAPSTIS